MSVRTTVKDHHRRFIRKTTAKLLKYKTNVGTASLISCAFATPSEKSSRLRAQAKFVLPSRINNNLPIGECNCGVTLSSEVDMKEHLRSDHCTAPVFSQRGTLFSFPTKEGPETTGRFTKSTPLDAIQIFNCPYCSNFFAFRQLLKAHIVDVHFLRWGDSDKKYVTLSFTAKENESIRSTSSEPTRNSRTNGSTSKMRENDLMDVGISEKDTSASHLVDID